MIGSLENYTRKALPSEVLACWYVNDQERVSALAQERPFCFHYSTNDYFLITHRQDIFSMAGHIGRTDYNELYFSRFIPSIEYFSHYERRLAGYLTFDKIQLFRISSILTSRPLTFFLHKTNLHTMEDEKHTPVSQTTISAGNNNIITTGNNNKITTAYSFLTGNLQAFKDELAKHGVPQQDIEEIAQIVQAEKPVSADQLPAKAQSWQKKMLHKSVDGIWKIGTSAAGHLLAEMLWGYYGLH